MDHSDDMHGIRLRRSHSTPDPDDSPSGTPGPVPDEMPLPDHAPVQEPDAPAPPVKNN